MSESYPGDNYPEPAMQRSARLEAVGRDREPGAVSAEMNRLAEATVRLEKVAANLRDRLEGVLLPRPSPADMEGATASMSRCDLAATIAGRVEDLENTAGRLEDLRNSIDL